jgi:hypothetical protein
MEDDDLFVVNRRQVWQWKQGFACNSFPIDVL